MERANGKGNSMKTESQIKHCLKECRLNSDDLLDTNSIDLYNNQGLIESLEWVLKSEPTMTVTPDLQVKVE